MKRAQAALTKRRVLMMMMTILMMLSMTAAAEPATTYDIIYSEANPIPAIAKAVRPAVVQVNNMIIDWSKETGEVEHENGTASGVYIDARGYFVTNNHVVTDADKLTIRLLDGTEYEVELVGFDDGTDLAVLYLEGGIDATPVPLGDSDQLEIGELAIVIGNPGAGASVLPNSVTAGIISALDREEVASGAFTRLTKMIQTDAAINVGNSGGALLNAKGELIGIPTLKYMLNFDVVYEGLGFAVPANTIKSVVAQIIEHGHVVRPRLGVLVMEVEGPDAPLKRHAPAGVQIVNVEPDSPAALAGLLPQDIVMKVNGQRVTTTVQLTSQLDTHAAGDVVTLTVCRFFDAMTGEPLPQYEVLELPVTLAMLD